MKARHNGDRACARCKVGFQVQWLDKRRFCTDVCRAEAARESKANGRRNHRAKYGRDNKPRLRALRYGAEYEPIRAQKVYERDAWRCGLCRKAINPDLLVPHPKAATVDHIVPLSKGGAHKYHNVQAAHFLCNSTKSDRSMDEQLLLVG